MNANDSLLPSEPIYLHCTDYEPVEEISKILDEYQKATGIDIPIHVDAASGGFIAPFTKARAGGPKWQVQGVTAIEMLAHRS